jgi:Fur family ferric uptake transcriptional regulator
MATPASPESVLNRLRGEGLRVSTPRRVVVKTLFEAAGPLTANEIAAGSDGAKLDPATVYRNLETLEGLELVVRLVGEDGAGRWRLAAGSGHAYLACHRCGALEEVDSAELDDLRELLRERFGYEAGFTRFPLVGMCPTCAATTN